MVFPHLTLAADDRGMSQGAEAMEEAVAGFQG